MSNPVVFFDMTIGGAPAGRIEMTLRADVVPVHGVPQFRDARSVLARIFVQIGHQRRQTANDRGDHQAPEEDHEAAEDRLHQILGRRPDVAVAHRRERDEHKPRGGDVVGGRVDARGVVRREGRRGRAERAGARLEREREGGLSFIPDGPDTSSSRACSS